MGFCVVSLKNGKCERKRRKLEEVGQRWSIFGCVLGFSNFKPCEKKSHGAFWLGLPRSVSHFDSVHPSEPKACLRYAAMRFSSLFGKK